jgi:hypothetical protein
LLRKGRHESVSGGAQGVDDESGAMAAIGIIEKQRGVGVRIFIKHEIKNKQQSTHVNVSRMRDKEGRGGKERQRKAMMRLRGGEEI